MGEKQEGGFTFYDFGELIVFKQVYERQVELGKADDEAWSNARYAVERDRKQREYNARVSSAVERTS